MFEIDSEIKAYFIGFIQTDGHMAYKYVQSGIKTIKDFAYNAKTIIANKKINRSNTSITCMYYNMKKKSDIILPS